MEKKRYLVIGGGMSGLAFLNYLDDEDYLLLEADEELGGYCKTVTQDGFVWDYSGHFFHFKNEEIERYLVERMPPDEVQTITKHSKIFFKGQLIDFPFQKNIHQLPQEDFIDCLYSLYFRDEREIQSFRDMVYARFGEGIANRFLVPYNEKLYACDLDELNADAMGRFFPHADISEIIRNFRQPDNASYNATFTYPKGGAIQYVKALASEINPQKISLNERVLRINLKNKIVQTNRRELGFDYLISTMPFNRLLQISNFPHHPDDFRANKVLVFNLGFDKKGWKELHWVYFPEKKYRFYRVGFYDNIFNTERMSLYIEIGYPSHAEVEASSLLPHILEDLQKAGIVEDHRLLSHHHIILDPAYVHITSKSEKLVEEIRKTLALKGIFTIGRYGGWTYCSIEDNILEARDLAERMNQINKIQ